MDNPLLNKSDFSHEYFSDAKKLIEKSHKILVWGDEDADGITSTSIMLRTFRKIGKESDYFIPSRNRDGIGLTKKGFKKIDSQKYDLLMTVDCGSVNSDEISRLLARKKKVIITDHHIPHSKLIEKVPYLNPHLLNVKKFNDLSGAGVSFVFSMYLLVEFGICRDYSAALDCDCQMKFLAGLGTRCDRVNNTPLNEFLSENVSNIDKCYPQFHSAGINEYDLCATVSSSKTKIRRNDMVDIFAELKGINEKEKIRYLKGCYDKVNAYRTKIRQLYKIIKRKADLMKNEKRILLIEKEIEHKYVGVLASMLTEAFNVPVCIIGRRNKQFAGECRANTPYNWVKQLSGLSECFTSWGGHPQAAGFTLKGDKIECFIDDFNSYND